MQTLSGTKDAVKLNGNRDHSLTQLDYSIAKGEWQVPKRRVSAEHLRAYLAAMGFVSQKAIRELWVTKGNKKVHACVERIPDASGLHHWAVTYCRYTVRVSDDVFTLRCVEPKPCRRTSIYAGEEAEAGEDLPAIFRCERLTGGEAYEVLERAHLSDAKFVGKWLNWSCASEVVRKAELRRWVSVEQSHAEKIRDARESDDMHRYVLRKMREREQI